MCDILLNELQKSHKTEEEIILYKRIKLVVEKIKAKAAHANSILKGLVSVQIASPFKVHEGFRDIHEATVNAYKSWHLQLNQMSP